MRNDQRIHYKRAANGETTGNSMELYGSSLGGSGILKEAPGNFRDTHGGGSLELRYRRLRGRLREAEGEMHCDAFRQAHGASLEMHCGRLRAPEGTPGEYHPGAIGKGGSEEGG